LNTVLEMMARLSVGRAAMLGMVLAAFYYFLVFDSGNVQATGIAQAKVQIATMQKQLIENQAKLDRAAVFKKTAAETGTTINRLLGVIPEHFSAPDLTKIVSNEARVAGSSLASITPGTTEISHVAKEFEEISVKLEMSGSFLQHMVFLSNLTRIQQILIVRKFDMNIVGQAKGEESPQVHMLADIVAYRYRGNLTEPEKPVTK
jgi:Tfp pilus assembly protein PilO